MKRKLIAITASALALTLALTACGPKAPAGGETSQSTPPVTQGSVQQPQSGGPATLSQIADYLLNAAADRTELTRDGLLEKLNAEEGDQANRVQALVMISRAFGSLPAAAQPGDVDLSGVPEWALADLENLKNSGVLTSGELAGSEEENRDFLEGDGTDLSAGEQADDIIPDDTENYNNGDIGVILEDEDLSDYEDNKVDVEGPGCPVGGGSPDSPDLVPDVVVPTLTLRSTITLSDVETVVNRILALG